MSENYYKYGRKRSFSARPKLLSVQELCGQKKTERIMIRTYSSLPALLDKMAEDNKLSASEAVNKLIIHTLIKKGYLAGNMEKKVLAPFTGNIEDMPLES